MKKIYFIGIDVSKRTLDFCILSDGKILKEEKIANHPAAIKLFLQELVAEYSLQRANCILCAEYTGHYTYPLACTAESEDLPLWLENPSQIKYSSGITRGKNDKVDARRIAQYACRFHDQTKLHSQPEKVLQTLKELYNERELLIEHKKAYQILVSDHKGFMDKDIYTCKKNRITPLIEQLENTIKAIEEQIREIINSSRLISRQMKLLKSVEGVGEKTALKMIIETRAFTQFADHRKFCCHAGVAPFNYTSGSSIHSKNKVSNRADKSIKKMLHLAALSITTKKNGELVQYYHRKVAEGKNKMTVINAIRAKIVARMFSVIRNDREYMLNYQNKVA